MKWHRMLLGALIITTFYALSNLIIHVPFAGVFSALAILAGILLFIIVFTDTCKIQAEIISNPAKLLITYWLLSFISIIIGFSSLYVELIRQNPHHFKGIADGMSAMYFSVVTFATVGFGDVFPVSVTAKFIVISEIIVSIVLLPITIGTSIAWFINHKIKQQDEEFIERFTKNQPNQLYRIK